MEISLLSLGLIILIPSFCVRIFFIGSPLFKFIRLFQNDRGSWGKDASEGVSLIRKIQIPGLSKFIHQELVFGFLPYVLILIPLFLMNLESQLIQFLDRVILGMGVMLLLLWLIYDVRKSLNIHADLLVLVDETERLQSKTGTALTGLRWYVWVHHAPRNVVRIGSKVVSKIAINHDDATPDENPNFFRSMFRTVAEGVEKVLNFPDKLMDKLADWAKEEIDVRLSKNFEKYTDSTFEEIAQRTFWSVIPALTIVALGLIHSLP